jgi:hypothetical protein
MTIPGFTAEASLSKVREEDYVLRSGTEAEAGRVLPQRVIHQHCGCFPLPDGGMYCTCV